MYRLQLSLVVVCGCSFATFASSNATCSELCDGFASFGFASLASSVPKKIVHAQQSSGAREPSVRFTEEEAIQFNEDVANMTVDEVLLWAVKMFPQRLVQFSSFGAPGMVILDKLASLGVLPEVPTVMIDTLHLFDETYEHIRKVGEVYSEMQLHTYRPDGYSAGQQFGFDFDHGDTLWADDFGQYTHLTKVEPTMRALGELDPSAWITGRRGSQGDARMNLPIVEWDGGRLKINPLAQWDSEQVWSYLRGSGAPYNPLHDQGYASIGDRMNTRTVKRGESERAGRFLSAGKTTECGMHSRHARSDPDGDSGATPIGVNF